MRFERRQKFGRQVQEVDLVNSQLWWYIFPISPGCAYVKLSTGNTPWRYGGNGCSQLFDQRTSEKTWLKIWEQSKTFLHKPNPELAWDKVIRKNPEKYKKHYSNNNIYSGISYHPRVLFNEILKVSVVQWTFFKWEYHF